MLSFTTFLFLSSIFASLVASNPHDRSDSLHRKQMSRLEYSAPSGVEVKKKMVKKSTKNGKRDLAGYPESVNKISLKRAHDVQRDIAKGIHPQILLQQHIHRAERRMINMKARKFDGNLDDHFEDKLRKRWISIHGHEENLVLNKRGVRVGHPGASIGANLAIPLQNARKQKGGGSQSSASGSGTGFSEVALQAEETNTVTPAGTATADNSVPLNIESNDVGYFGQVFLGTPPAPYQLLFDTGSADLWVPSSACTQCGNHKTLGPDTSSTLVASTTPFKVTYGSGDVAGTLVQDTVTLAGLTLQNKTFGVATEESESFSSNDTPFDGLMGMALEILSEQQTNTVPIELAAEGVVQSAIMAFRLGNIVDIGNGANPSELTIGGVDSDQFEGSLTTVPNVSQEGFFAVDLDDISVSGQSILSSIQGTTGQINSIMDTGTTLMVAPQPIADAIHANIPGAKSDGQGGYTIPCTTTATLAFTIGGTTFTMHPSDLTFSPVDTNDLTGDCVSGVSGGTIDGDNTLLAGDIFLNRVYAVFDATKNQVSFATTATS